MTTKQEFENRSKEIDNLVNVQIKSDNPEKLAPVTDGIINIELYFNAKPKILWILKEPYDELDENGEPCGGGWDMKMTWNEKQTINDFGRSKKTFEPMTYVSWSILNNFCSYKIMKCVEKDPSMLNALKSVAIINIKKLPGLTSSSDSVIEDAYEKYKDILLKQIKDYEPDIIIGGRTLSYFLSDLGIDTNKKIIRKEGHFPYYIKGKQLFIDAYHPAQRPGVTGIDEGEYCDDIINTVKLWAIDNIKL